MSSNTIEREIVQMDFDVKQFRKGTRDSIQDIEALKKSFDFKNAQKSFAALEQANNIKFDRLQGSLDSLNRKVSVVGVAVATVISNITNSIINGAKSMFDALVVAPVTTGLEEYETQLNAVQTILANTSKQGTTLEDVNAALDELNQYADLTIYNFTEMTRNIGTFTAAGVELDTSVQAIKGIANLAAVSGSNAQQASTAMYQLSQAIASGVVRLQDWNSVQNAGLGGQVFQDALVETARVHGVNIDKIIADEGSFRASLAENWLSSEILLESLSKFTGDLSKEQLLNMGYTEEQADEIIKLGEVANDAATKIKTFTQLIDTLKEALQSGWAQSWRIILGDFEEAKALWGDIGGLLGDVIGESADARNKQLQFWSDVGGREKVIEGVMNLLQSFITIFKSLGTAFGDVFGRVQAGQLLSWSRSFAEFAEKVKMAVGTGQRFKNIFRGIFSIFKIGLLIIKAILKPIMEFINFNDEMASGLFNNASKLGDMIFGFAEWAEKTDYFGQKVREVIAYVKELIEKTGPLRQRIKDLNLIEKVADLFAYCSEKAKDFIKRISEFEIVVDVSKWFKSLERKDLIDFCKKLLEILRYLIVPFYLLAIGAKRLYEEISKLKVVKDVVAYFKSISWTDIKNSFNDLSNSVRDLIQNFKQNELVGKFVEYFKTFDGRRLKEFFAEAKTNFSWVTDVIDFIKEKLGGLGDEADAVGEFLSNVFSKVGEGLGSVLDYLIENAGNIDYSKLFDIINSGLLAGILVSVRGIFKGDFLTGPLQDLFGEDSTLGGAVTGAFGELESTLTAYQQNIKADSLQKIAISIALLAGAIALFTLIDKEKLLAASGAVAIVAATLFGSAGALGKINTKDALKASLSIIGLAIAFGIVSIALKNVADLDANQLEIALAAMATGLAGLVLALNQIKSQSGGNVAKTVVTLLGLGVALLVLETAVRKFGEMDPDVLAQGLLAISASIALLVGSVTILSKVGERGMLEAALAITDMAAALIIFAFSVNQFGEMDPEVLSQGLESIGIALGGFAVYSRLVQPKGMIKASIAIGIMATALLILAQSVAAFGKMSWEELIHGLVGMGGALLILVIAANLMNGALAGAAAMFVMSLAVLAIAGAMKVLSTLSWEEVLIGLATLAGVFIILGLAGLILTPVVPTLLLLGVALGLIGLGALLFGAGVFLAATALVALAGSAALVAGAIGIIGGAIIELIPKLAEAVALAIGTFLTTIAEHLPEIIDAGVSILLGLIEGIGGAIPQIADVILTIIEEFLGVIAEHLEPPSDIIQAGFDILLSFLKGIEDNISEVVSTALAILTELIDGIIEGVPGLVDKFGEFILTFLKAIDDAVVKYLSDIIDTGVAIAIHILEGVSQGITDNVPLVIDAIKNLIVAALEALGLGFLIGSPSRVTYKMAGYVVQGFANGIEDGIQTVKRSFAEFSREVQNGINPIIRSISDEVDKEMEFRPVIAPILNLDDVSAGLGVLDRSFRNASVLAKVSAAESDYYVDQASFGVVNQPESGVTFIQNNYSPKVLDRMSIYRDTKTLTAKLSARTLQR